MKYDDALVAVKNLERNNIKERITTVEKKLKEIGDAKSSFATAQAAWVTTKQMESAVEDLKVSLKDQIKTLEKAIGEQASDTKQECYDLVKQEVKGCKESHEALADEHRQVSSRPVTVSQKLTPYSSSTASPT
jgi:uncharacterized protein (UPF0305 family)